MNSKFSRRAFVQQSSLAGLAALVHPLDAIERFEVQAFALEDATIPALQDAMRAGKETSRSLCRAYLRRIDALDRRGPTLRSVIETNPEALAIADELDRERKGGRVRGPLHGIPVLVKDNINTGDRMLTSAGSLALSERPAPHDAFVVNRLRAAGAVILGKTNLSEWANFRGRRSISGWSARGGLVKNPYALDRNACGSSSGTGAAIAANLAAAGIGTETDGSIVCPSSACSLVGIKPTLGLVSRAGIIPIAHSQDTAGPMCRTVTDAAIVLTAIAGRDPNDPATSSPPDPLSLRERGDYVSALDPNGLKGARIGVAGGSFRGYSRHADRLVAAAIEVMKAQGAEIIDDVEIPHANDYDDAEYTVLLYEFKADLNAYLQSIGSRLTLKDLIEFNERNRAREMPYFGQEHFERAEAKGPLSDDAYVEALARCRRLSRAEGIDVPFAKHKLDAIVSPTGGPPWPTDLVNGDHFLGGSSSAAAVSGYPNITVPVGYAFGLPVGMSLIGKPWTEGTLIKLAFAYEQAAKPRRAPRFRETVSFTDPSSR